MHALVLVGLLAATAAEPVAVDVTTHPLTAGPVQKDARPTTDLVPRAQHAMRAHLDSRGQLQYQCEATEAMPDLRFERRVMNRER
ncbi:MAG: hypothetical protein IT479_14835 [Xanthomonadales bacterium]|nr:hypothetical protein [Xanthomonadales bacterium]MCC6594534.1 hypothetical protein [Xanthomonadales bacterium]MCE7931812.1 hypothetical protein [Xanthomonadales bacterium PRO6]